MGMTVKSGWFILVALLVVMLLATACGPQADAPTLADQATAERSEATEASGNPTEEVAPSGAETSPTESGVSAELPVDEGDWHVLGSPDAPITMVEYSDFQ
jgi:protein-disulfide isomerase